MTVAVAASWISSAGLVSAIPALTITPTGYKFVWWQLTLFIAVILYLGLFMAIPLKRQMIQVDSLRFPANIPTGETLLVMYAHGGEAMKKAVALLIAGLWGVLVAALRDGLGWIPGQLNLPWRLRGITLSKLTLGIEPSLIFISIGGLLGIKVGLSLLLGLVLNYGILAPRLIEAKIIQHPPPQIKAVAAVELPLEVKAGQTFTVQLERAVSRPEFPSPDELKDNPELSSAVRTSVLRYTWTRPTVYSELAALNRDLSTATLQDGSRNPLHGAPQHEYGLEGARRRPNAQKGRDAQEGRDAHEGRDTHDRSASRHRVGGQTLPAEGPARRHGRGAGIRAQQRRR